MISDDVPQFPRGFVLSMRPVDVPSSFEPGPLLSNFHVHPWLRVDLAGDADQFVAVLGICVRITGTDPDPAGTLLERLRSSEEEFFRAIDDYAGRHAIIYGTATAPRVVNDATGMRAVFYAADGGVISSHALLVERALGGEIERNPLPFQYGYPGNRTPYERTRLLIPNTSLEIDTARVFRFWPTLAPAERTVDEVAEMALEAAANALREISQGRNVKLALTAGLDSRTMLAVALRSGVSFETYTYGRGNDTATDRAVAADLSAQYGIEYTVTPKVLNTAPLRQHLEEAHYKRLHAPMVNSLMSWFADPSAVSVSANLLEIGRSFYRADRRAKRSSPTTAAAMSELHQRKMGPAAREDIDTFGQDYYKAQSDAAFQEFIDDTAFEQSVGYLDPFDQFYWEHRMATWHGTGMLERDFYAEAFIPFNARSIFEAMLGIPQNHRDSAAVFYRMIESVDPRLLDMPINPKEWPPKT
ncbi:MAG: hypothetical protein L0G94_03905 [Brachybacterium sp.]|uniref:hypothetical protein n=1 Tax=Brachybacterium sp. TaxID=1891286 RepID=UPI002649E8F9|nr:hypothetical protein [Brachybacterium sp.]MDN5685814.1 hypothetical protein [Brachybacterium sp.]